MGTWNSQPLASDVELMRWSHTTVRAGATTEVDIRLGPVSTVTGTVRDALLEPVAHAEVSLRSMAPTVVTHPKRQRADRGRSRPGWVTVDGLDPAEPGRTPVDPFHPGATAPFELTPSRNAMSIELKVKTARLPRGGRVVDAGSPSRVRSRP